MLMEVDLSPRSRGPPGSRPAPAAGRRDRKSPKTRSERKNKHLKTIADRTNPSKFISRSDPFRSGETATQPSRSISIHFDLAAGDMVCDARQTCSTSRWKLWRLIIAVVVVVVLGIAMICYYVLFFLPLVCSRFHSTALSHFEVISSETGSSRSGANALATITPPMIEYFKYTTDHFQAW